MTGRNRINHEAFEYHARLCRLRQAVLKDLSIVNLSCFREISVPDT